MQSPEIWADQKKASELGSQIRDIKDNLEFLTKWQGVIDDTETALEIADEELLNESAEQLNVMEKALEKPLITSVRSAMPGREAMETCGCSP